MHVDGLASPPGRRSKSIKLASPSSSRESSPLWPGAHYVHPFKSLYRRRFVTRRNWAEREPKRVTFACHANNVVTCLQFDKDKIVSASDDHSINVFDTRTGATKTILNGHEGGVWALQYIGNILVSGSTDRTVRIWDLEKGECTHVFVGHTSTVRCLQIIEPENINPDPKGQPIWEPPYPLIVTGSRDWSLRVWKLPSPGRDNEYHPTVPMSPTEDNTDPTENPFHLRHLAGHRHAVRALAAHGRTLVSGSYDCTVRVWDVLTGECKFRLQGHTQKVYSVVYDPLRKQCASGSMDGTVRLWSTETGELRAVLEGHTSLVGLLGLSFRNLVSAAADSTLRIWDPETGECRHSLAAHSGAITCFQHDEYKVISGSDGTLKMWDVRDGTFTRDLLTGLTGVWQVSFDERFCVAAVQRNGQSEFEILDFGPVNGEVEEEREEMIKLEEVDDIPLAATSLGTPSDMQDPITTPGAANSPIRPRNPPPPFLRPGEFPRASPSSGVTSFTAYAASASGGPRASGSGTGRVVRRAVSSRNLQASSTGGSSASSSRSRRPLLTIAALAKAGLSGDNDALWDEDNPDGDDEDQSLSMDVEFDDVEHDSEEDSEEERPRAAGLQW